MESSPGRRIQQWRDFKGLTLSQVSRASGIKITTLSTAEQPGASNPSFDTLSKLLSTFPDLNPDWLLTGNGPMLRGETELTPAPSVAGEPRATYTKPVPAPESDNADTNALREAIALLNRQLEAAHVREEAARQREIDLKEENRQYLERLGVLTPKRKVKEKVVERKPAGFAPSSLTRPNMDFGSGPKKPQRGPKSYKVDGVVMLATRGGGAEEQPAQAPALKVA